MFEMGEMISNSTTYTTLNDAHIQLPNDGHAFVAEVSL